MLRRILAFSAFLAVVALALFLLYRVYIHHTFAEPYFEDDRAIVHFEANFAEALS